MEKKINKYMRSDKSQIECVTYAAIQRSNVLIDKMCMNSEYEPTYLLYSNFLQFFFFFRNILTTKFLFISQMRMYVIENNLYFYLLSFSNYSCSILLNTKA